MEGQYDITCKDCGAERVSRSKIKFCHDCGSKNMLQVWGSFGEREESEEGAEL